MTPAAIFAVSIAGMLLLAAAILAVFIYRTMLLDAEYSVAKLSEKVGDQRMTINNQQALILKLQKAMTRAEQKAIELCHEFQNVDDFGRDE